MSYSLKVIPHFRKELKRLAKKYPSLKEEIQALGNQLQKNPTLGIHLGNNVYKVRLAIASKGKGKRGGARVITYVAVVEENVYLLSIYSKSEKNDIDTKEIENLLSQIPFQ